MDFNFSRVVPAKGLCKGDKLAFRDQTAVKNKTAIRLVFDFRFQFDARGKGYNDELVHRF
ncbi:hypothetical protein NBRC116594_38980 [Shimia sp. NS0008-38b]